ncbi:MAG: Gfo/Idh/MocA family oxidoreductase [Paludibaculum sp.]
MSSSTLPPALLPWRTSGRRHSHRWLRQCCFPQGDGVRIPRTRSWNLAAIGAGGQPAADLKLAHSGVENVVALADVDWARGKESFERFPEARKYRDFREMLGQVGQGHRRRGDSGTPDHMHAYCAIHCMQAGEHVYVEKPLTRLSGEARMMAAAAERYKVATQMGNQGYSHDATRVACEIFWSGADRRGEGGPRLDRQARAGRRV